MFSDRIGRISPSATLAMTAKAAELRSAGVDLINLSVGDLIFLHLIIFVRRVKGLLTMDIPVILLVVEP